MPSNEQIQEWIDQLRAGRYSIPPGTTMEPISYKLLSILQHYAPTGIAQQLAAEMVHQAICDGADVPAVRLMLSSAITDGLKYGNWPWNTPNSLSDRT